MARALLYDSEYACDCDCTCVCEYECEYACAYAYDLACECDFFWHSKAIGVN